MSNSKSLYPLQFKTIFKDKIWGGQKIKTILGKDHGNLPNCGETWELSGVKGDVSEVSKGFLSGKSLNEVIETYKSDLLGKKVYNHYGHEFPLLIKFIDANDDLSIQVHPDDILAKSRHNSFGKTEMWYIMQADPNSFLYVGFDKALSGEAYKNHILNNTILDVMHKEYVNEGDVFFIPAGRVHSIGKGILLAEIQQTSDITYRIYDFDRRDSEGNSRQLHTEESVEAIDFTVHETYKSPYIPRKNDLTEIVESEYFQTELLEIDDKIMIQNTEGDTFNILICMKGEGKLGWHGEEMTFVLGDVLLIPACIEKYELFTESNCKLLRTYAP